MQYRRYKEYLGPQAGAQFTKSVQQKSPPKGRRRVTLARPRPRGGNGAIRSRPSSRSGRSSARLAERVVMKDMLCDHTTNGRRWHGPSILTEGVSRRIVRGRGDGGGGNEGRGEARGATA